MRPESILFDQRLQWHCMKEELDSEKPRFPKGRGNLQIFSHSDFHCDNGRATCREGALVRNCNIMERILVCQNLDPEDMKANMTTMWMGVGRKKTLKLIAIFR